MYALNVFSYAFRIYKRGILKENEWNRWLRMMMTAFKEGTMGHYWVALKVEEWCDFNFQYFINNEVISEGKIKAEK